MVGSTGTLMTMRLVRSKLRKREESSASPVSIEAAQEQHHHNNHHNQPHHQLHHQQLNNNIQLQLQQQQQQLQQQQQQQTPAIAYRQSPASVWVFPPLPPQPNLFCTNSQDALIQFEKAGLKGFRKQFSGRFKRLVSRKPEPAPVIPPELKPQLKTIYVY